MPGWGRPTDVWFDHGAAVAAAEAVAALRFVLATTFDAEAAAAEVALQRWDGRAATRFETSFRARANGLAEIALGLRLLQTAIDGARSDAIVEQHRIDAVQQQWDREERVEVHAAEDARRAVTEPGVR